VRQNTSPLQFTQTHITPHHQSRRAVSPDEPPVKSETEGEEEEDDENREIVGTSDNTDGETNESSEEEGGDDDGEDESDEDEDSGNTSGGQEEQEGRETTDEDEKCEDDAQTTKATTVADWKLFASEHHKEYYIRARKLDALAARHYGTVTRLIQSGNRRAAEDLRSAYMTRKGTLDRSLEELGRRADFCMMMIIHMSLATLASIQTFSFRTDGSEPLWQFNLSPRISELQVSDNYSILKSLPTPKQTRVDLHQLPQSLRSMTKSLLRNGPG
jgi:hypothetical protein